MEDSLAITRIQEKLKGLESEDELKKTRIACTKVANTVRVTRIKVCIPPKNTVLRLDAFSEASRRTMCQSWLILEKYKSFETGSMLLERLLEQEHTTCCSV
jgi:hypothetical protein